ncbi:hypothetical protein Lal_00019087 [Lupinus albus]|nr:hypothetical protein Lal_00019087 [Lupinus albus]
MNHNSTEEFPWFLIFFRRYPYTQNKLERKKKSLTLSLKREISRSGEADLTQARILQPRQVLDATFLAQARQLLLRRDHSLSSETTLAQARILQYSPGFHPLR